MTWTLIEAPIPNAPEGKYISQIPSPNNLLMIASALKSIGITDIEFKQFLKERHPPIVKSENIVYNMGEATCMSYLYNYAMEYLQLLINNNPDSHIYLTGYHTWLYPDILKNISTFTNLDNVKITTPYIFENEVIGKTDGAIVEYHNDWSINDWNWMKSNVCSKITGIRATFRASRGCTHKCLDKDTDILLSDFTTKKINLINIGDKIIGVNGNKLCESIVLNIAQHNTEAYEIIFNNKIKVICSGEHRWLTNRGWKYTIGSMSGKNQRPYLTSNNIIFNVGKIVSYQETKNYKEGYISGIMRGDGCLRCTKEHTLSFRLAMKDKDAINRTKQFLSDLDFNIIRERICRHAKGNHSTLFEIRSRRLDNNIKIRKIIKDSNWDDIEFIRGFIAGIFDAEGSYSKQGQLRISNTNREIIEDIKKGLNVFKFNFTETFHERKNKNHKDSIEIYLKGGIYEIIRFFNIFNPIIYRKKQHIFGKGIGTNNLKIESIKKLDNRILYDLQTSSETFIANGLVSHNCEMCPVPIVFNKGTIRYSVAWVMKEINTLYHQYGIREIGFLDDNLCADKVWIRSLLQQIIEANLKGLRFTFEEGLTVPQALDEELVSLLKQAKFYHIKLGIEALDSETLNFIKKPYRDPKMAIDAIKNLQKYKLNPTCFICIGFPTNTEESIRRDIKILTDLKVKLRVQILYAYPGIDFADKSLTRDKLKLLQKEAMELTGSCSWHKKK